MQSAASERFSDSESAVLSERWGVVMADGLTWEWETFPEYLDALGRRTLDIDVAAYLPHSPLRVYAMAERGADRAPANA